jgi:hypothetical protein
MITFMVLLIVAAAASGVPAYHRQKATHEQKLAAEAAAVSAVPTEAPAEQPPAK